MTREEFIKQRCEIDKITEEEFEKRYRVVKCNCGQPYCKGYRCLDLNDLLEENQELKKQLKDKTEDYRRMKDNFDSKVDVLTKIAAQQKEFINYLEDNWNTTQDIWYIKIFQKYKEIIGVSDEKEN